MYQEYIKYFEWQATKHPQLAHSPTLGNRVFAVIDQEAARGDFRSGAKEKGFIMRLIEPSAAGAGTGDPTVRFLGGFIIAKHYAPRSGGDADRGTAKGAALKVGMDIVAKITNDSNNGHSFWYWSANTVEALDLNIQPRDFVGDVSYGGWMFTFRFSNPLRLCLAAPGQPAWLDGGVTPDPIAELQGVGYWTVGGTFVVS